MTDITASAASSAPLPSPSVMTPGMVRLFAFLCGAIIANIYYAQPIIGVIAPALGLSVQAASLIVSFTQIGFAFGVFLLVPLGDIVENRRLIVGAIVLTAIGLALAATAQQGSVFLAASMLIGLTSVAVQMLVPLVAHLAPEASRGRIVGNVMSGLTLGIVLARPVASLVTDHVGWRALFGGASVLMMCLAIAAALKLPRREPGSTVRYTILIWSLVEVFRNTPILRLRSLYQGFVFSSFSMFWTAVPIELARNHGFSQTQIALFALMGATGVLAGPLGGRVADAGHTRVATRAVLSGGTLCVLLGVTGFGSSLVGLCLTAVLIDFFMQFNMVMGQRAIYALPPENRSRLNALYMTSLFIGGAVGSSLASTLYDRGGWHLVAAAASVLPGLAAVRSFLDRARSA